MADAPDSKFGGGNSVRVQVPPPAPLNPQEPVDKIDWKNFSHPLSVRAIKRQLNNKLAQRPLATYTSRGQRRDSADINLILLQTTYPHRSAGN
jgi:hypothetical protein